MVRRFVGGSSCVAAADAADNYSDAKARLHHISGQIIYGFRRHA